MGDKLDVTDIHYLLDYSKDKDLIVTKIIDVKGDKLDVNDIHYLLKYSKNNLINTKKIISFGHMISEERYTQLVPLLQKYYKRIRGVVGDYSHWEFKYLTDGERIKYIETKGDKLYFDDIFNLIEYSKDKDLIATKIIEVKGEKLISDDIQVLLKNKSYKMVIKIIETLGVKVSLNDLNTLFLQTFDTEYKDRIATKIIEIYGENLNYNTIVLLVALSNDIELIKKKLLQKGIDYKLINDVITKHKIDTPLIPYNYQSMLQEIRRIKEIMI